MQEATTPNMLHQPIQIGSLQLRNRIVMAPMTRSKSPGGVPGEDVAAYYRRRAEGGTGLIISEGAWIPHPVASDDDNVPRFYGDDALVGWMRVIKGVHEAGAKMFPQLWHVGQVVPHGVEVNAATAGPLLGPSGLVGGMGTPVRRAGLAATPAQIADVVRAYGEAAASARELGFDGVEIHGAHGYLIDQFLWDRTNRREDGYGGDIAARTRFAVEVIREVRARVGGDFPISFRLSTWKLQDFEAKLAHTPDALRQMVLPLSEAGVDIFHLSERRFWEGSFGSPLNLAGWVKQLTGKPTIAVGSVTLDVSVTDTITGLASTAADNLHDVETRLRQGEFDLIAVGRAMIANADWARRVRDGKPLRPFDRSMLGELA
ncbi:MULTISPECIES: NADH:flavin oxidoreductase [Cupriavidus]